MNFEPGMNILPSSYLHSLQIAGPAHIRCGGASGRVHLVRKSPFYATLWQLTARDRRLAQVSNVGSVKWKAQTANKPSLKPGASTALKWWQVEKWQKLAFCAKCPLFSNPVTNALHPFIIVVPAICY